MFLVSGLTRWGPVPAVLLMMRNPAQQDARIVYLEDTIDAPVEAVFAVFEREIAANTDAILAREAGRLLTVRFALPADLTGLAMHQTLLALTFEPRGEGTALTLTHAGFGKGAAWDAALDRFTRRWPTVVEVLRAAVEDGQRAFALAA